jgi:hypothetical protein
VSRKCRSRAGPLTTTRSGNLFAVGQTVGQPTRTVTDMSDTARARDATLARIPEQRFCPDTEEVTGSNSVSSTKKALVSELFTTLRARLASGSVDCWPEPIAGHRHRRARESLVGLDVRSGHFPGTRRVSRWQPTRLHRNDAGLPNRVTFHTHTESQLPLASALPSARRRITLSPVLFHTRQPRLHGGAYWHWWCNWGPSRCERLPAGQPQAGGPNV